MTLKEQIERLRDLYSDTGWKNAREFARGKRAAFEEVLALLDSQPDTGKCLFFGRHDHSICEASQSRKERETADSQPQPSSSAIPVIPDAVRRKLKFFQEDDGDCSCPGCHAQREEAAEIRAFLASAVVEKP